MARNAQDERLRRVIAQRLREARDRTDYSLASSAEAIGVAPHTMYMYERVIGGVLPPVRRLRDLAQLYRVSLDWLCGMRSTAHQELLRVRAVDVERARDLALAKPQKVDDR